MKNMKIKTRLLAAFVVVIVLALIVGAVGIVLSNMISEQATVLYKYHIMGFEYLAWANDALQTTRIECNKVALFSSEGTTDIQKVSASWQTIQEQMVKLDEQLELFSGTIVSDEVRAEYNKGETVIAGFSTGLDEFKNATAGGNISGQQITAALDALTVRTRAVSDWIDAIMGLKEKTANKANEHSNELTTIATIVQIGMVIVIAVTSMLIAFMIARGVEKDLRNIIGKLTESSSTINSSASQLNEASENLASGSSKQAAAIEQTSATMNETESMIAQNAENTRVAAQLAADTTNMANKGMSEMQKMTQSMGEIKESSDTVSRIVKTIDDIAFQTNLLAINATVEAARAGGDAGRSFGVVAEEVRNLAQKSAEAAASTTEIIEKNISLTHTGRDLSRGVAVSLEEITEKANQLNKLIEEIHAASEEQASGIKQINIAITQMEAVTQENAAVAEENAASSNSMKDEIANLESAIVIAKNLVTAE